MKMKSLLFSFLLATTFETFADSELVYVGSCSWGNTSINSCTNLAGNALSSFYVKSPGDSVYVFNRITADNENYCIKQSAPRIDSLRPADSNSNGIWWKDDGSTRDSGLTLDGALLNQVQLGTAAYNDKQHEAKKPMIAYPTCFLLRKLN